MPGLEQRVDLERRADGEAPAGVLPGGRLVGVEALVAERVLVEDGHLVPGGERHLGDGRADPPGADDQNEGTAPMLADAQLAGGAVMITRQGALVTTYFVTSPTNASLRPPPRPPSSAPPRTRVGSSAARTIASTPRRRASSTIACPARRARTVAVATCDALVLLPHRLGPPQRRARLLELRVGQPRVDRQRHRHLEDPQRLDRRRRVARRPRRRRSSDASRPAVWTMSSSSGGADERDEDRPVLGLARSRCCSAACGHLHALEERLVLARAVDDVEREAERHPADADVARALVEDEHAARTRATDADARRAPPAAAVDAAARAR